MTTRYPVSIIIEVKHYPDKAWMTESWSAIGVIPVAKSEAGVERSSIYQSDQAEQFLYTGHSIELFADEAESYYANLSGDHPSVFVVCEQEEDDELRPLLVTLSYDEMASYIEVDTPVFDLPIPPPVYEWVEAWVLENYQPEQRKKRTRQKWADESWKPLRDPVGR
ncbi:MAG TPA: DUF3305 domain-containing protein [Gammaproteobacteria bacterium]|nr:DUF3305 domain-containing protein [Gammaproteobacteria bacterium]